MFFPMKNFRLLAKTLKNTSVLRIITKVWAVLVSQTNFSSYILIMSVIMELQAIRLSTVLGYLQNSAAVM